MVRNLGAGGCGDAMVEVCQVKGSVSETARNYRANVREVGETTQGGSVGSCGRVSPTPAANAVASRNWEYEVRRTCFIKWAAGRI